MYVVTALAVALLHVWVASADDCLCYDNVCLYEPIRSQLTSTYNADSLLLGFFTTIPFYGSVRINSAVNLTVISQEKNGTKSSSFEIMWTHFWYPYSSTGVLRKLFPSIFRGSMDPWSALPVVVELVTDNYFVTLNLTMSISCASNGPLSNTKDLEKSLNDQYSSILQWGKSFGRTNGPGAYAEDSDRGIVYDATQFSPTDVLAFDTFVLLYVVFNIAVAILLMTAAPMALKSFLKQIQEKMYIKSYIKSLFWSSVVAGMLYIIVYIIVKSIIYTKRNALMTLAKGAKILDHIDDFTIISFVVPLLLLGVHIVTAVYVAKAVPSEVIVPKQVQRVISRFCCRSCGHVLWMSSLWVVLAWLQLIAVSFIPVVVSILTDTFRSIAVFGLLFTTIVCVVVCGAALIQTCKADQPVPKIVLLFSIAACFSCSLAVGVLIAYFLVLSREGLDADTVAGYVLSLIPSVVLAALAYFAENILVGDGNAEDVNEDTITKRPATISKKDGSGNDYDELDGLVN